MKINRETAQKLAEEKYGSGVFVGDLNEIWDEANRRAKEEGKKQLGQIRLERLDGTQWDDYSDSWVSLRMNILQMKIMPIGMF